MRRRVKINLYSYSSNTCSTLLTLCCIVHALSCNRATEQWKTRRQAKINLYSYLSNTCSTLLTICCIVHTLSCNRATERWSIGAAERWSNGATDSEAKERQSGKRHRICLPVSALGLPQSLLGPCSLCSRPCGSVARSKPPPI
jgi:hypothetical protein